MASMTDVVFLLLVFFMVTSTFVFPTALEVNLPQSSEQTQVKATTHVYIDADGSMMVQYGEGEAMPMESVGALQTYLNTVAAQDSAMTVAIHGDRAIDYGRVVSVLNAGAANNLRMVLATTPDAAAPGGGDGNASPDTRPITVDNDRQ